MTSRDTGDWRFFELIYYYLLLFKLDEWKEWKERSMAGFSVS